MGQGKLRVAERGCNVPSAGLRGRGKEWYRADVGCGVWFAAGSGLCDAILGKEGVSRLLVHSSLASLWASAWRVLYQKIQWMGATKEGLEQEPW